MGLSKSGMLHTPHRVNLHCYLCRAALEMAVATISGLCKDEEGSEHPSVTSTKPAAPSRWPVAPFVLDIRGSAFRTASPSWWPCSRWSTTSARCPPFCNGTPLFEALHFSHTSKANYFDCGAKQHWEGTCSHGFFQSKDIFPQATCSHRS